MTNDEKIHGASLAADQPPASPSRSDAATARHTAAPWAIEFDVPCMFDIAVVAPNFGQGCLPFVAFVECKDHPDDDDAPAREEAIANAHLIAAAPELLKALKSLLALDAVRELWDDGPLGEGWQSDELSGAIAAGDAAIAKAEGKG